MDKETLSHYGWIVIAILISSLMFIYVSPLGANILTTSNNSVEKIIKDSSLKPVNHSVSTFNLMVNCVYNSNKEKTLYVKETNPIGSQIEEYIFSDEFGQKSFYGFITDKEYNKGPCNSATEVQTEYTLDKYESNLSTNNLSEIKLKLPQFDFAYSNNAYYSLSNKEKDEVKKGNDIVVNIEYICKQYKINYYLYDYKTDSFILYQTNSYTAGYGCPLINPETKGGYVFSGWFSDSVKCKQECSNLYDEKAT